MALSKVKEYFIQVCSQGVSVVSCLFFSNSKYMRLLLAVLLVATSTACAQPLPDAIPVKSQVNWATPVKQNANLYRIDDKLYRSEQLTAKDAEIIATLGIKSVVNLRYFSRKKNQSALSNTDITLLNRPLLTWNIRPEQIAETLYLIEQQQKYGPVLVHCYHGADRTGLISGMYRIIFHGWSIDAAKAEMQKGPYGYHSVWKNIERLFTENTVQQVRMHLNALHAKAP